MKKNRSCNAVSEILATVLLLGIAVSLFSVLYVIVISSPVETPLPSVILVGSVKGQTMTIDHHGGVALNLDTEILATVGGAQQNVTTARDYLDASSMSNDQWDIGEKLVIDVEELVYPSRNVTDLQIEVTVVDVESNSILLTGVLREGEMISTVSLSTSVDAISPYEAIFSPANITATGDSRLDNVTLWYRYSPDNSSWGSSASWWNDNWNYYRTITIDHDKIDEKLTNFPVLVEIGSAIGSKCDDGDSIRFIGTDNSTEYYYEIEEWDSSSDSYVWVNITSVSSTVDTTFLMYYNNSAASDDQSPSSVWDSNYVGVWHLSESTGMHYDSTSNNHDSSTVVGVTQDATGKINGGDDFDGSNDYIDITMNLPSTVTISAWAKDTAGSPSDMLWCIDSDKRGPDLWFSGGNIYLNTWNGYGNPFCAQPANVDEWHLYSTVIESGNTNLYINNQLGGSANYKNPTGSDFHISSSAGYDWQGSIDEVRVSKIARNSSWLNASFHNQNDISSFLTIESEQSNSAGSNWTSYSTDVGSPWQWNFNFPNSTGYYEFYSIGKNDSNAEDAPGSADAICYYNPSALLATSVDAISPYETEDLPLNLTATGDSRLDNVTLWYRYSTDNSSWWNNNWNYYRTITIDHTKVDENLVNFPVLVKINSTIGSKCDNGDSIRFIGTDNSTEYYYEIEEWNSSGDSYVWVNITSISSTMDTAFLMYYNNSVASDNQNPNNVWDTNYAGVWHLSESTGMHYDSTSNNHDSSTVVGVTQDATGKINGGDDFDGSNDYIDITMNLPSTVTISAWAKDTAGSPSDMLWCIDSDKRGPDLWFSGGNIYLNTWNGYGNPFCAQPANVDEWHLYSTVIESGNTNLYINNQLGGSANYKNPTGSDFHISSSAGYDWQGSIDEVRVSKIARNSSWLNASFHNQNDISSFLTIESEQIISGINWTNYSIDTSSPWRWNFNFPNSAGYYEFYSIGKYNDGIEEAPGSADAICWYNPVSLNTSVDTIIPYDIVSSPANITATGDSRLDNVTLWYRYSTGNSSWWNSSWLKRKTINLNTSSGSTPSNYQVFLNITYDSDMNTNFSDLRFVNYSDNSTELDYWIESKSNSNWAQVWIEIGNSITTANKTHAWMYYGNSDATSASNGTNTFLFFDDFSSQSYFDAHWTYPINTSGGSSATFTVANGYMKISGGSSPNLATAPDVGRNNYTIEFKNYFENSIGNAGGGVLRYSNGDWYEQELDQSAIKLYRFTNIDSYTELATAASNNSGDTWYDITFKIGGSSIWAHTEPQDKTVSTTDATFSSGVPGVYRWDRDCRFDDYRVRKYISTEPTYSTGSEENCSSGWQEWDNASQNPDTSSPWSWGFDFPNDAGYYEFYSIGRYNGDVEEAPGSADTNCYYNLSALLATSIDTISPYEITYSPANITATGDSRLDNVTLWYRYSTDNSSWWNNSWNYYRTITIDHNKVDENLANFPVLVKINSTIGSKCDSGDSIRFIGTDNSTEYYYEIEEWNSSGDSYVWVNITSISSTADTTFLMYYNNSGASDNQNPSNVWDTNYVGVWHLSESSGTHYDSTSNNHDSSTVVGVTQDATGKINGGDDFDGSNDYIDITMNLPSTVTISTWAKATAGSPSDMLWCIDSDKRGPDLWFSGGNIYLNTWNSYGNPFCSQPANVNEWHLYSTVIESGNTNLYINNQLGGSANYKNPTGSDFHISSSAGYDWQGGIDEVRVSNIARNSSWINASFQNQNDISSFLTIESEQSNSAGGNWTSFSVDNSSPWQWSFNFPNGTGYYEFYSIGKYNGDAEEAPGSADAICHYN